MTVFKAFLLTLTVGKVVVVGFTVDTSARVTETVVVGGSVEAAPVVDPWTVEVGGSGDAVSVVETGIVEVGRSAGAPAVTMATVLPEIMI